MSDHRAELGYGDDAPRLGWKERHLREIREACERGRRKLAAMKPPEPAPEPEREPDWTAVEAAWRREAREV